MGFFSWNCKVCGKSIRSQHAVNNETAWMNDAEVWTGDTSVIRGSYDGYGRVSSFDLMDGDPDSYSWYHQKCADSMDASKFSGPSEPAWDQGYFIDD